METIVLSINGKTIPSSPGKSILDAARENGIHIPTLCHHPALKPYGACRICIVEDVKSGRIMASCVTPVAQGMEVLTDSDRVLNHRRNIVRLMMAEHPESCLLCSKGNRCELRNIAASLGISDSRLYPMPNYKPFETVNPFIVRDLSKCILCGKCIRADHELVVTGAIDYAHRGFESRPATLLERPLEESECTFCGTCVSICPTGALAVKPFDSIGTPEKESEGICCFCAAGCTIRFGVTGHKIISSEPPKLNGNVNGPTLCVRGHFGHDYLYAPDRLTGPLKRDGDPGSMDAFSTMGWDEALGLTASMLAQIKRKYGPQSIAFMGSSKCTNEENYLFQKIARAVFETPNITSNSETTIAPFIDRLEFLSAGMCRNSPLSDLEETGAILTVMADPDNTVPVAGYHIKRAAKKGIPLVVISTEKIDLVRHAALWIKPVSGLGGYMAAADFLFALAAAMGENGGLGGLPGPEAQSMFNQWKDGLPMAEIMSACKNAGMTQDHINKAASILSGKKVSIVLPGDASIMPDCARITDASYNLALASGSLSPPRTGIYFLAVENNAVGAFDMGCLPHRLPGRRDISNPGDVKSLSDSWGVQIRTQGAKGITGIVESIEAGKIKALYVMGENPARALPGTRRVIDALKSLECLVVQDIFFTETASLAHIILAGAAPGEKFGSYTNMEGRIQSFAPATRPPAEALPDWAILGMLAKRLGYPEQYNTIEAVRQEIRRTIPAYSDLGGHRTGWIKDSHAAAAKRTKAPSLGLAGYTKQKDHHETSGYPYHCLVKPLRWNLGSGTRTMRSKRIASMSARGYAMLCPDDAGKLGISAGDVIKIISEHGTVERKVQVMPGIPGGCILLPPGFFENNAAGLAAFSTPQSPWRHLMVKIEKSP